LRNKAKSSSKQDRDGGEVAKGGAWLDSEQAGCGVVEVDAEEGRGLRNGIEMYNT